MGLSSTSDSEVITQMLAAPADVWTELPAHGRHTDHWLARLHALQLVAEGAYSLVVLTRRALYAMR
ncbi:MAG: hypothetical protein KC418_13685, partial [Anaerolineales bacterium]|nr:hypothetical protein [Anaerolineales bacterium]